MENREIKFRAFDKEGNEYSNEKIGMISMDEWYLRYGYQMPIPSTVKGNRYEFMQFTGLKDSLGREIYDGDILEFDPEDDEPNPPYYVQVIWEKEDAKFYCEEVNGNRYGGYMSEFEDCKVIGNIYENGNLLCGGK